MLKRILKKIKELFIKFLDWLFKPDKYILSSCWGRNEKITKEEYERLLKKIDEAFPDDKEKEQP